VIAFLDTSALVKRYVAEAGSTALRTQLRRRTVAVARIAQAELPAALARRAREGTLPETAFESILDRIERDFARLTVVEIRPALVRRVASLVRRHPLRAYDAVQLSAALTLAGRGAVELWAADGDLLAAARLEGLRTVAA